MSGFSLPALLIELVWLALLAAFAFICVAPLYGIISADFLKVNIITAALFAFYFRCVLFFRQIFYLKPLVIQILFATGNIILFIAIYNNMQEMFYLFDTYDIKDFMHPAFTGKADELLGKFQFYRNEYLLFTVGVLLLIILVELRLLGAFIERIRAMK